MKEIILLLVGAGIGFVGSIFGSVIVGREEEKRSTRLRLFRDLLPNLHMPEVRMRKRNPGSEAFLVMEEACEAIYRETSILSTEERRMAWALTAWLDNRRQDWGTSGARSASPPPQAAQDHDLELALAFDQEVFFFEEHLEDRIRPFRQRVDDSWRRSLIRRLWRRLTRYS